MSCAVSAGANANASPSGTGQVLPLVASIVLASIWGSYTIWVSFEIIAMRHCTEGQGAGLEGRLLSLTSAPRLTSAPKRHGATSRGHGDRPANGRDDDGRATMHRSG